MSYILVMYCFPIKQYLMTYCLHYVSWKALTSTALSITFSKCVTYLLSSFLKIIRRARKDFIINNNSNWRFIIFFLSKPIRYERINVYWIKHFGRNILEHNGNYSKHNFCYISIVLDFICQAKIHTDFFIIQYNTTIL